MNHTHTHTHHTQHTNTHTCSDERKHESVWLGKDPQAWQRSAVLVRILGWLYYLVTDRQRAFIYGHGISQSPSSVEIFIASIRNGFFTLSVHINEILRSWKSLPSRGATCPSATPLLTPNPHTQTHTLMLQFQNARYFWYWQKKETDTNGTWILMDLVHRSSEIRDSLCTTRTAASVHSNAVW